MTTAETRRELLRNIVADLEDEGYEVFLQPSKLILPRFLKNFRPDAVAHRGGEHLVVALVTGSAEADKDLPAMTTAVRANPGWSLRLIIADPTREQKTLSPERLETIKRSADEMAALIREGLYRAAMLVGWSTLEALGRAAMPAELARPQNPKGLVQILAQEGYVLPTEAELLRKLADKRNALIHGEVQTEVSKSEAEEFAAILGTLMELQATAA
ncbi:hypothetical protein RA307_12385 [Xanthobacteraceae bacterium Astr-EGSB]|uniref:hypothetical protein n=1 Tax=Astrobacterium formosum TaxID=3069710 RepID=UPI0027B1984E|nr:hypothetical protein [Xanthobacteraceae bacterium Astr-EGSB]